jgi:hypothetical protein
MAFQVPVPVETTAHADLTAGSIFTDDATPMPLTVAQVALTPSLAAQPEERQGSWFYFHDSSIQFAPLANLHTRINLLPPIVEDPFVTAFDIARTHVREKVVPSQLRYEFHNGMGLSLLQSFLGTQNMQPDEVDLTKYLPIDDETMTPFIYNQGVEPESYANAIAQHINLQRTANFFHRRVNRRAHADPNLGDLTVLHHAQLFSFQLRPSTTSLGYTAQRLRHQMRLTLLRDDLVMSYMQYGFLPIYNVKTMAPTTATALATPEAAQWNEQDQMVLPARRNAGNTELFSKNTTPPDAYTTISPASVTPDMQQLEWRCISNPLLQTAPKGNIHHKDLQDEIHQHLARNIPLLLHVNVYESWRERMLEEPEDPLIPLREGEEDPIGSHFFVLAGYDRRHYLVINSMGEKVGMNGTFLLPKKYVRREQRTPEGTGVFFLSSRAWSLFQDNINPELGTGITEAVATGQSTAFTNGLLYNMLRTTAF